MRAPVKSVIVPVIVPQTNCAPTPMETTVLASRINTAVTAPRPAFSLKIGKFFHGLFLVSFAADNLSATAGLAAWFGDF